MRAEQVKLKVVWLPDTQQFEATHPNTNVTGHGPTPGEAIRNWQFWWNIAY